MGEFLRVDALRMEFGGLVAVRAVSFTVGEGEFVGADRSQWLKRIYYLQLHKRAPQSDSRQSRSVRRGCIGFETGPDSESWND